MIMAVKIRKAREKDLKRIFEIEKRSYPPELQTTQEILKYRFNAFGIWVAEMNDEIVGFSLACQQGFHGLNRKSKK